MKLDWNDKAQVIAYAKKLGKGLVVIREPNRSNYNIVHADRTDLYLKRWTVYET